MVDTSTGAEEAFEAYAKAGIKIPDAIPLIGGIEVGNAALGLIQHVYGEHLKC